MDEPTGVATLSLLLPEDTIDYQVKYPGTDKPTGWVITLAAAHHEKAQRYARQKAEREIRKAQAIEQSQYNFKKVKVEERSLEDTRRENVMFVVSRIIGWNPVSFPGINGGNAIEFSDDAALDLLLNPKLGFVFSQLVDVINDDRSFMPRSVTN